MGWYTSGTDSSTKPSGLPALGLSWHVCALGIPTHDQRRGSIPQAFIKGPHVSSNSFSKVALLFFLLCYYIMWKYRVTQRHSDINWSRCKKSEIHADWVADSFWNILKHPLVAFRMQTNWQPNKPNVTESEYKSVHVGNSLKQGSFQKVMS